MGDSEGLLFMNLAKGLEHPSKWRLTTAGMSERTPGAGARGSRTYACCSLQTQGQETTSLLQSPPLTYGADNPHSAGYSQNKCKEKNTMLSIQVCLV